MLTHVHYGETLCGWQYRSKGEVKGVESLVTRVTECIRWRTGHVQCSAPGTVLFGRDDRTVLKEDQTR
jgi:hypothetical protein